MTELVKLGRTDLLIHPIGLGANKIAAADPETNTEYGGDVLLSAINKGLTSSTRRLCMEWALPKRSSARR